MSALELSAYEGEKKRIAEEKQKKSSELKELNRQRPKARRKHIDTADRSMKDWPSLVRKWKKHNGMARLI